MTKLQIYVSQIKDVKAEELFVRYQPELASLYSNISLISQYLYYLISVHFNVCHSGSSSPKCKPCLVNRSLSSESEGAVGGTPSGIPTLKTNLGSMPRNRCKNGMGERQHCCLLSSLTNSEKAEP